MNNHQIAPETTSITEKLNHDFRDSFKFISLSNEDGWRPMIITLLAAMVIIIAIVIILIVIYAL